MHFGKFLFEICMRLHKGERGEKRKIRGTSKTTSNE